MTLQGKLDNSPKLNYNNLNEAVDYITDILVEVAEKAKIKSVRKKGQDDPPWFDESCKKLKEDIRVLGKKIRSQPRKQAFKTELCQKKKQFKKQIRANKFSYKNDLMEKMNQSKKDSKTFWKLLGKMEKRPDESNFKQSISEHRWTSHFKSIFQGPNGNISLPKNTSKTTKFH